ncbi:uncharacterized protein LOC111408283 [Olea europaea var. sylvestris]|uniref:uncharacterized protein LOC111408283 n=1 Tax=Olea europaea var. sylvestris TaxID=158386 RepID=UPI000C1D4BFC|nr:uncharacterized protein LOC111408283 [Olea europaea var. sylvestris]
MERSQAHSSPPDTEVESLVRTKTKRPPTGRTLHFSRGESSRSQIDEVKSKEPKARRTASVFDRLGTHHSLTPTQGQTDLKRPLEQTEPKLSALKKRIAGLEAKNKGRTKGYQIKRHSPFAEDVLIEPLPEKLKIPHIAAYEGDSDPLDHLDKYTSWMELQGASSAIMCLAFSLTLGDKAQRWFRRLHERLVKDWDDLPMAFLAQFMGSKARTTPKERLIQQAIHGSRKRFDDAALMVVLAGLRPKTRFWWSIHEDGPWTYHKFLNRAEKHISAEEATSDQEEARREIDLNDAMKEKKSSRSPQQERKKDRREKERPRAQPYKFREYHPLKASLKEVFMQANTKEAFRRPIVLKNEQAVQRQGRYCRYHRTMGHDTDNCRDLKEEVESLIQRDRLQVFVAKPKKANRPMMHQPQLQGAPIRAQQAIPNHKPPPHAEIKMMVGGNQYIEGSRRARRRQARSAKIVPNY